MELDMTQGSPGKLILRFTLPIIIGNVFQQLYNMVDAIIVGRFVGNHALAAVGATGTIMFLILGFMQGLTTGFTVLTSQRFGAGDESGLKRSVGNAAILSVIVTVLATVISLVGMKGLLRLMQTPEDIFEMSYTYISIICFGMWANILYNLLASLLRAVGNAALLFDCFGWFKCSIRFGFNSCVSDEGSRSSLGYCNCTRSIWDFMFNLYCKESPNSSS